MGELQVGWVKGWVLRVCARRGWLQLVPWCCPSGLRLCRMGAGRLLPKGALSRHRGLRGSVPSTVGASPGVTTVGLSAALAHRPLRSEQLPQLPPRPLRTLSPLSHKDFFFF